MKKRTPRRPHVLMLAPRPRGSFRSQCERAGATRENMLLPGSSTFTSMAARPPRTYAHDVVLAHQA